MLQEWEKDRYKSDKSDSESLNRVIEVTEYSQQNKIASLRLCDSAWKCVTYITNLPPPCFVYIRQKLTEPVTAESKTDSIYLKLHKLSIFTIKVFFLCSQLTLSFAFDASATRTHARQRPAVYPWLSVKIRRIKIIREQVPEAQFNAWEKLSFF